MDFPSAQVLAAKLLLPRLGRGTVWSCHNSKKVDYIVRIVETHMSFVLSSSLVTLVVIYSLWVVVLAVVVIWFRLAVIWLVIWLWLVVTCVCH